MYFIRTKEEIHLSFKNSEKQQTQALKYNYEDKRQKVYILQTISNYKLNLDMTHTK